MYRGNNVDACSSTEAAVYGCGGRVLPLRGVFDRWLVSCCTDCSSFQASRLFVGVVINPKYCRRRRRRSLVDTLFVQRLVQLRMFN